ncbi:MAG TPA: sigma-70 family RNA polymerase sigma factor [Actinobacteria bacterium]|nr:sigma-70 family RNA polymerase sigma factor [Actinomycetota bacterium]
MAASDDRHLRESFARGQESAIRRLYDLYGRAIFGLALRVLGDRSLAEEATQLTFLKAWQAADRVDPNRPLGPWLYTIARRVAIDLYRRERRHAHEDVDGRDIAVLPPTIEHTWEAWRVRTAVDELPAVEREIIELTHFLGLTHEEAAARLGIPVGTVKSRSHRAHRRLALRLARLREASA